MWLFSVIWEVITYHVWTCSKKYIIAWTLIMHESLLQSIICMVNVDITCTNEWLFICFLPQFCFIKTVQNSVRLKMTNFKSASKSRYLFSRGIPCCYCICNCACRSVHTKNTSVILEKEVIVCSNFAEVLCARPQRLISRRIAFSACLPYWIVNMFEREQTQPGCRVFTHSPAFSLASG